LIGLSKSGFTGFEDLQDVSFPPCHPGRIFWLGSNPVEISGAIYRREKQREQVGFPLRFSVILYVNMFTSQPEDPFRMTKRGKRFTPFLNSCYKLD
jgi:hypothetical protein